MFSNPLTFKNIPDLIMAIVNVFVIVLIPIVVFFLIWGGFLYATARGNAEQIQKAGRALLYGVIGGVIIIGAEAIMVIVKSIVTGFK
ncbi:hypothetical protein KC865_04960 [Candidatus Kaiserbacteria bacterium]|nr:hypothetical protein [Candidatus Kaiserbacteria bacterium]USN92241.1 MAG: hypothetical protein H6782_00230 [Candidatus Nomurabacteria bacterium]